MVEGPLEHASHSQAVLLHLRTCIRHCEHQQASAAVSIALTAHAHKT